MDGWSIYLNGCQCDHVDVMRLYVNIRGSHKLHSLDAFSESYLNERKESVTLSGHSYLSSSSSSRETLREMALYNSVDVILTERLYLETDIAWVDKDITNYSGFIETIVDQHSWGGLGFLLVG